MEKRELYLCNSVYQVLVALWIKYRYSENEKSDIIISNHMNGGSELVARIRTYGRFDNVYFSETLDEARYRVKRTKVQSVLGNAFPVQQMRKIVPLRKRYTDLYAANFDGFTQLLFNALSRQNKTLKLHAYEDGLSTYCSFEPFYRGMETYYAPNDCKNIAKRFLRTYIYRKRTTYGNVTRFLVFNPEVMQWDPGCAVDGMDKIDRKDPVFRAMVNRIFDYEKSSDRYDRRFLFFEESFYADGYGINDVELIEKLAEHVGKENIMVKIHPRNPENRFAARGYKTNKDTGIPWEVILMNLVDVSGVTFVTIASSAILNPIMIFGQKIRAYSLYPCLSVVPETLQGSAWTFLEELFEKYSEMITLAEDIDSIK